jgi:hypothetical protein
MTQVGCNSQCDRYVKTTCSRASFSLAHSGTLLNQVFLLLSSVPRNGGHDGLLFSAALIARLDATDWRDMTARGLRYDSQTHAKIG